MSMEQVDKGLGKNPQKSQTHSLTAVPFIRGGGGGGH